MNTSSRCYLCHSPLGTCDIDGLCARCRCTKQPAEILSSSDNAKTNVAYAWDYVKHNIYDDYYEELIKRLEEKGKAGLDLSPGDPDCLEAATVIKTLRLKKDKSDNDKDIEKLAIDFEKKHGTHLFLKASISVLNKVLVEKGMITKQEIQEEFVKTMKEQTAQDEQDNPNVLLKVNASAKLEVVPSLLRKIADQIEYRGCSSAKAEEGYGISYDYDCSKT